MKALLEDASIASSRVRVPEQSLSEGTEKAFQGLLVGVTLGILFWVGLVVAWIVL